MADLVQGVSTEVVVSGRFYGDLFCWALYNPVTGERYYSWKRRTPVDPSFISVFHLDIPMDVINALPEKVAFTMKFQKTEEDGSVQRFYCKDKILSVEHRLDREETFQYE